MTREICIHGHFYQPPRENPWLEEIETQDSAYPHHDWNDRITEECYAPNSASRILDSKNRIVKIINNYSRMSFNFGPTLLAWMELKHPLLYRQILKADHDSRKRFSGHGAALAQPYNHMIMPLANTRDKRTQIYWGLKDFSRRFGRHPEGMWLPETAVDLETLDLMAEFGISFTILAPQQAKGVRQIGDKDWKDVSGGIINPRYAYQCQLPSGRSIALFFYEGTISREISFGKLLEHGDHFAERLISAFGNDISEPQLVHIATDGETFGHHHRFADMALAYCLHAIEHRGDVRLTIYADFLERNPPVHEVKIIENSSWSCAHGVERWRSDCGCRTGGRPEWKQAWRGPLRSALDRLRDRLAVSFESGMKTKTQNAWKLRNDYIDVILDRSPASMDAFFDSHGLGRLSRSERNKILILLEAQRCAQLMYTSCGWFFSEISGIETVQILSYASRAVQLTRKLDESDIEASFIAELRKAPGNLSDLPDGAEVYEQRVRPGIFSLFRMGVHTAVASLFPRETEAEFPSLSVQRDHAEIRENGRLRMAVGLAHLSMRFTGENMTIGYGALHLGGHNVICGVCGNMILPDFERARQDLTAGFENGDVPAVIDTLETRFGRPLYSMAHLFRDRKRRVIGELLAESLNEFENVLHPVVEQHAPLIRAAREMAIPLPWAQSVLVEFSLTMRLRRLLEQPDIDLDDFERTAKEIQAWQYKADKPALRLLFSKKMSEKMADLASHPKSITRLSRIRRLIELMTHLDPEMNLWESQNHFNRVTRRNFNTMQKRARDGDGWARRWVDEIRLLGEHLKIHLG